MRKFRRFWVKVPRHSETIFAKKRYTSIVALVGHYYFLFQNLHTNSLLQVGVGGKRWGGEGRRGGGEGREDKGGLVASKSSRFDTS